NTAKVLSGSGISIKWLPFRKACEVMVISVVTDLISSEKSISNSLSLLKSLGFSASPSHVATLEREVTCTTKDTNVQKTTILKISRAWGTPAAKGSMAKIIGTATRNPTQDTKNL